MAGTYDESIKAAAADAIRHIGGGTDRTVIGLGSGRAATAVAREIAGRVRDGRLGTSVVVGVPTSLQIKLVVEEEGDGTLPLIGADQTDAIDVVFDGADQIDAGGYVVKGGGGALLRENILFSMASKVVVIADATKFVRKMSRPIPVEVHRLARRLAQQGIRDAGGKASLRTNDSGYPVFTENGNIILDCSFGPVSDPGSLSTTIKQIPGVLESGIFMRRPDIIYKAGARGKFREMSAGGSGTDLYTEDDPDLMA